MYDAALRLTRSRKFLLCVRSFKILLDEREIGTIKNGAVREFQIEGGRHSLQVTIGAARSQLLWFDVPASGVAEFRCEMARLWTRHRDSLVVLESLKS